MPTEWEPGKPTIMWLHNTLDQLPPEAGALFRDPAFLAEAKQMDADISPTPGEEVQRMIAKTYAAPKEVIERVEKYCKEQQLFHTPGAADPEYTDVLELDLKTVTPSLAGPRRP